MVGAREARTEATKWRRYEPIGEPRTARREQTTPTSAEGTQWKRCGAKRLAQKNIIFERIYWTY
jgi:hypothetical protein